MKTYNYEEVRLFVEGEKPALLIQRGEMGFYDLEMEYPFIEMNYQIELHKANARLYFKCSKKRDDFVKNGLNGMKDGLPFHHCEMGKVLGFPPKAVQDFLTGMKEEEKIKIDYHGLQFVTKYRNVKSCLKHLKKHLPVSMDFIEKYGSQVKFFDKRNGFFEEMEEKTMRREWKKIV